MKEKNVIISSKISELLKENDMSQVTLSALSGISQQTITGIMQGKHTPKDSTLQVIADTLGVYKEYLTGDTQYKNFDSWVNMNMIHDFSVEQKVAIIDLLNAFGYLTSDFDSNNMQDFIIVDCPNGQKKGLCTTHLKYLLNNFFTMFDSILLPEHIGKNV